MRALDTRGDADARARKWSLIEFAAADLSSALRVGAVEELLFMLHEDRERAVSLFEKLLDGYPELLRTYPVQEFLRYGLSRFYARMKPFILAVMEEEFESIQQRGSELICIASISPKALSEDELADAQNIAETVIVGRPTWRRGAARIYAFNVTSEASDSCVAALLRLIDDDDVEVRKLMAGMFAKMRDEHILTLRPLLEAYASSPSLEKGWHQFSEFLWNHAAIDPQWAIRIVDIILNNPDHPTDFRQLAAGEELIRLILRVYNDPLSNGEMRRLAMNLFDRLMERYAFEANRILSEWDIR
jgi:hypothetical protein